MKQVQVKHVVFTATGVELHLSCIPSKTWVYVPGTTKRTAHRGMTTLHFAGIYNVEHAVAILKRAPLINPKTVFLDTPYTVERTGAYLARNYRRQGQTLLAQRLQPLRTFNLSNVLIKKA